MSTKMKGLFKGLRYISQIFDEDEQKEEDMQIGLPTDVKHVAHVGWDGPASANSDSKPGKDNSDVKWVSEDSRRAQRTKKSQEKEGRRRSTDNNPLDTSPKKEKASRRQSADNASAKPRRTHPKDSSGAKPQDPDAPKKTRRKKSEAADQPGTRRSKNRSAGDAGPAGHKPTSHLGDDDDEEREESRLD